MKTNFSGLLRGISLIALAVPAAVHAQPTDEAAGAGTEHDGNRADTADIIVTAQFRAQNLQDTPLAITAVNSDTIRSRSLDTVVDIAATAPSLEIRSGGTAYGPAPQIYIRGIGQVETTYAYEPGVGLYVDDVYYGSALGSVMDLLDLDRIEILRGPQGTLAGRNSVGGAIKLFSKKPEGSGRGYVEVGYGSRNRIEARGSLDLPIIGDQLALRVSGIGRRQSGYLTRLDFGCLHPGSGVPTAVTSPDCVLGTEGGTRMGAVRAALRWRPTPRLDINIIGTLSRDDSEAAATKLLSANYRSNVPAGFNQSQFITGPHDRTNYATYTTLSYTDPPAYAGLPGYGTHQAIAVEPVTRSQGNILSGQIDYEMSDAVALTSITAYQHMHGNFGKDIDLTPYDINTINYIFDHKQFTQELRLNAGLGDLLDLTLGGFYYESDSVFSGIQLNAPGAASQNVFLLNDIIKSESKSLFAHTVLHLTRDLNVTGGIRYTDDSKSYQFARRNPYYPDLPANASSRNIDGLIGTFADDRFDYRINVDYRWSEGLMTYAQVSTGYRGGGVNPRPYVPEQAVGFGPESVTSYEIGFKSDLIDRTLRVNGDVFMNKYKDIIFFNRAATPNSNLNATPVNAGDGTYKGAELEIDFHPRTGLSVQASVSYLHFQLDRVSAAGADIVPPNMNAKAPYAPEWKYSLGAQYEFDAGSLGKITPRVDMSYQSEMFPDIQNTRIAMTEARTLVNIRLGWTSDDGDWQGAFAITNLFDKFYYRSKVNYPVGAVVGDLAPPREWRVSLRRNF